MRIIARGLMLISWFIAASAFTIAAVICYPFIYIFDCINGRHDKAFERIIFVVLLFAAVYFGGHLIIHLR